MRIRLVLAWLVISVMLIVMGGQKLHDGLNNGGSPTELSIEDIAKNKPTTTWLKIKDGVLVLPLVTWMEDKTTNSIDELFIPVAPAREGADFKQTHVLLRTKRPDLIARVHDMRRMDNASEAQQDEYIARNAEKLLIPMEVTGLVEWGVDSSSETRHAISGIDKSLASDFLILRDGEEPHGAAGFGLLALGLVSLLGGGAWLLGISIRKPRAVEVRPVAMREPKVRPRDEPKMIEVDADLAQDLGLGEKKPAKPITAKVKKPATGVVKVTKVARPERADEKPDEKPAAEAAAKPEKKTGPLIARKKRILPS